jgi:hypothetical protein
VPELIDPVFAKASPKRLFSIIGNERFELVFAKTWSKNSGTDVHKQKDVCGNASMDNFYKKGKASQRRIKSFHGGKIKCVGEYWHDKQNIVYIIY